MFQKRRTAMTTVAAAAMPRSRPQGDEYEPLFEIIDGKQVELPPMSILASRVTSHLIRILGHYLHGNPIGEALMETLFHLPLPVDRNRRPDVAFVSAQTIAAAPPQLGSEDAWAVLPELMVEVVSPSDLAEEVMERIGEYFAAGTKLMWVIYPTQRLVYVYESPLQIRVLNEAGELDGGAVLPGFRIAVASLFPR
jgi:Uma2 family endonuclease